MKYLFLPIFLMLFTQLSIGQNCNLYDSENFETDLGIWSCGIFCTRSMDVPGIAGGTYSIALQSNSVTQSTLISDVFDMTFFDSVRVEYNLYTTNLDGTFEHLYIDLSNDGGTTFSPVVTNTFTNPFNNAWSQTQVSIASSNFGPSTVIRFRSDISGSDRIYLDNVSISRCTQSLSLCSDGIKNGDETGVDCGGSSCDICPCDNVTLTIFNVVSDQTKHLKNTVTTFDNGSISNNVTVNYYAENSLELRPNFCIDLGVTALFDIDLCLAEINAQDNSPRK